MNSKQLARKWPFKRFKIFERELRNAAAQWFYQKGIITHAKMPYCLKSLNNWPQNIICDDVVNHIRLKHECNVKKNPFPFHKYLHHGLSSQAMVFNLVGPLIVRRDLQPLQKVIEKTGISWPTGTISTEFEYSDREVFNEDSGLPTSLDLVISGKNQNIFIEAKLAEKEFGGCSVFSGGDCEGKNPIFYDIKGCYLHHIGRKYWEIMDDFHFRETTLGSGPICPFTSYYQFFREVLFTLKKNGSFLLLHDERNPAFLKSSKDEKESGLWPFLMESVPAEYAHRIKRITIQQLVKTIAEYDCHQDWIEEFKLKYGITS